MTTSFEIPQRVIDRYLASLSPEGECLVSSYSTRGGYTQIGWNDSEGKTHTILGHRVAWFAKWRWLPTLPDTIDHICHNQRCGNPAHLQILTNVENSRQNGWSRRTHCKWGHEYTPENTRWDKKKGGRVCVECRRRRYQAFQDKC